MAIFDELTIKRIAKDLGGKPNVRCKAGIADIVLDDEIVMCGALDDWNEVLEKAKSIAKCMNMSPTIMLTGDGADEVIDEIDTTCDEQDVMFYYYDGMSLSNLEYILQTSRDKCKQVANILARRHGISARSNLMGYEREMFEVLYELESGNDPIKNLFNRCT